MAPGRIKALRDDVVLDVRGGDVIEKPFRRVPIAAFVDVDRDARRRVACSGFHSGDARFEEADQVIPLDCVIRRPRAIGRCA